MNRTLTFTFCLLLCLVNSVAAESWFFSGNEWVATRLKDLGFEKVQYTRNGVGGVLLGQSDGPILLFSSNEASKSLELLEQLKPLERGKIVAVFGKDIKLTQGDFLLKVDYDETLAPATVAIPQQGPSIDLYEIVITKGTQTPAMVVAADLLLTLQTRAQTADAFIWVQLEQYRLLANGDLAIDLSIKLTEPSIRGPVARAVSEFAEERTKLYGARVVSIQKRVDVESGKWPRLRQALEADMPGDNIITQDGTPSSLDLEHFGRPEIPSLTLRVSERNSESLVRALARVIRLVLALER